MTRALRLLVELVGWSVLALYALGTLGIGHFVLIYG
jgi:hypothetical protein